MKRCGLVLLRLGHLLAHQSMLFQHMCGLEVEVEVEKHRVAYFGLDVFDLFALNVNRRSS